MPTTKTTTNDYILRFVYAGDGAFAGDVKFSGTADGARDRAREVIENGNKACKNIENVYGKGCWTSGHPPILRLAGYYENGDYHHDPRELMHHNS